MSKNYIWEATNINGEMLSGVNEFHSRDEMVDYLDKNGFYRYKITAIRQSELRTPLSPRQILTLIDPLIKMLDAGLSFKDTLRLLANEPASKINQYIYKRIWDSTYVGEDLETSFCEVSPLIPRFFIAMLAFSEKSGDVKEGLKSLYSFYKAQDMRKREVEKIVRYPKVVAYLAAGMLLVVLVLIVPMFNNIYELYGESLPGVTRIMVMLSDIFTWNIPATGILMLFVLAGRKIRPLSFFHPISLVSARMSSKIDSANDIFLYTYALRIMLKNGVPLADSVRYSMDCLSLKNRKFAENVANFLNQGYSISESFSRSGWFTATFLNILSIADQSGSIVAGLEQNLAYIERKREEDFQRWSRLIEPIFMVFLGLIVLVIMLSIYLPIFDLGNQFG